MEGSTMPELASGVRVEPLFGAEENDRYATGR